MLNNEKLESIKSKAALFLKKKQVVYIKTIHFEGFYFVVKLYSHANKLFAYNRYKRFVCIDLNEVLMIRRAKINGSFYYTTEQETSNIKKQVLVNNIID